MIRTVRQFPAQTGLLGDITTHVEECAAAAGLTAVQTARLGLVLEEAFVNICSYAYPQDEGIVEIRCEGGDGSLSIEMADCGAPFNVLSLPEPDTGLGIMERGIGGLGIHFIRSFSDAVAYRREREWNVLRMEFKRSGDA